MAKTLGYGGVANTNGARDFTGKTPATPTSLPFIQLQHLEDGFTAWSRAGLKGDDVS